MEVVLIGSAYLAWRQRNNRNNSANQTQTIEQQIEDIQKEMRSSSSSQSSKPASALSSSSSLLSLVTGRKNTKKCAQAQAKTTGQDFTVSEKDLQDENDSFSCCIGPDTSTHSYSSTNPTPSPSRDELEIALQESKLELACTRAMNEYYMNEVAQMTKEIQGLQEQCNILRTETQRLKDPLVKISKSCSISTVTTTKTLESTMTRRSSSRSSSSSSDSVSTTRRKNSIESQSTLS